ncbi:hypothetical protein CASP1_00034 [Alcaligenes phage CASP1]|nr:hypothetical protein CASP1_00034 [Alcaligenes phage CASP1]
MFREGSVLKVVHEFLVENKGMGFVAAGGIKKPITGEAVKIESIRMSIRKVCNETGIVATTKVVDGSLLVFIK